MNTTPIWHTQPKVYVPPWKGRGRHPTRLRLRYASQHPIQVKDLVKSIPQKDWGQAIIKEGSKGPIACEFAFLRVTESRGNLPAGDVWLIIRRNLDAPSVIKYYFSNAPANTPLAVLSVPVFDIQVALERVRYYQKRNWDAYHSHRKAKLATLASNLAL